jgi:DNA replication protein DnaC
MSDTPQVLLAFKHHRRVEHRKGPASRELAPVKKSIYSLIDLRDILLGCNRRSIAHLSALDDFSAGFRALGRLTRPREVDGKTVQGINFFAPAVKSLDSFDFLALPSLNKALVLELARSEYVMRRENVIALGNSGTGKTHVALGLGLAACQKGLSVGFTTAAAVVHELIEARDEKRLLRLQRQLAGYKLLVIDELGYVPLSQTGAELLFEVFSQRYERGSTIVTSNLPFDEWTGVFASERLTGALLDRLTHHVHILEMNGDSYRLKQSKQRQRRTRSVETSENPSEG